MTSAPQGHVAPDSRPVYRIAVFGLGHRFQRLLSIIVRHARHNQYRFEVAEQRGPGDFDIALVDMTASGGAEVARTLRSVPRTLPVVGVGRRSHSHRRGADDLLFATFSLDVLGVLNKAAGGLAWRDRARDLSTRLVQPGPATQMPRVGDRAPRALIVDPSGAVRSQIALALRQIGVDAEGVGSLAQAEDVLSIRRYELMVLEPRQPDGDGIAMIRRFRHSSTLNLPIIILSGRSGVRDIARAAWAGCQGYLGKPVALTTLHQTVGRVLARSLGLRPGTSKRRALAISPVTAPDAAHPDLSLAQADAGPATDEGPMTLWRRAFGPPRQQPRQQPRRQPHQQDDDPVMSAIDAMAARSARQPEPIRPLKDLTRH